MRMKKEAVEIAVEGLRIFPDEDSIIYHNVGLAFFPIFQPGTFTVHCHHTMGDSVTSPMPYSAGVSLPIP